MARHPLTDAARASDARAFGAAYDEYAPVVYGLLMRMLRNPADAQELLQETFIDAWTNAARYDPERGSELAWLITMARSRALMRMRSQRRRVVRDEAAGRQIWNASSGIDPVGHDPIEIEEARAAVHEALDELPAAQRTALEMAYFDGLSQTEIAGRLGEPLGTIKTRTNLAMKKLRERLRPFRRR